jgi:catechol 2,3-dioxygenase-like lactoylglutathione lyase family enzyme
MSGDSLKRITQIAIVVIDIDKTLTTWSKLLGIVKPEVIITEDWESTHMTFKGKPSKAKAKLAFVNMENVQLEFIEPIGRPSTWQEFLDKHGEGIHHIAFQVENLEETLDKLGQVGAKAEQKGDFKGGCYIYTNSKNDLAAIIEILHSDT